MPKDIKLFTLAKELNVGIGSFKESLEKKDVLDVNTINPNTRVPRQIAEQLIAEHGRGMGKAEISQLLDKLDGSAATPKTEPAKSKEEPKPESRPAKETHIETVIPEDRRPSLNIKGSIADLKPKAEVKPEPKVEVKPEPKPEPKATPAPKPQPEAKPAEAPAPAKVEEPKPAKPEAKTEPAPKPEPKVEVKPEPTPAPEAKAPEKEELDIPPFLR